MTNEEFNIGVIKPLECLKEAWTLIKPNYWLLFAIAVLGIMMGSITLYILLGAMVCGVYLAYLQAIDGGSVEFELLFKNCKQYFVPSLPVVALTIVPVMVVVGVIYFPLIIATAMEKNLSESDFSTLIFGSLAVDLFISIIMVCLHTLLMFAFPLIVDRNLSGGQSIRLSALAVWKNLSGVTALWAVMFAVNLLGLIACCVGIYLTIPIILATQLVAYRKVFPRPERSPIGYPPPPSAFNL